MNETRQYLSSRRVRVTDCDENGNIRVDAIARYLQDIGYDDTDDIGVGDGGSWVARSIEIESTNPNRLPKRNDLVNLKTFCSGIGRAFAQRTVEISRDNGIELIAKTIWVCVNENGKPIPVPSWLNDAYPNAEKIKANNILSTAYSDQKSFKFKTRASDIDVNDHINNSIVFNIANEVAYETGSVFPSSLRVEYYLPFDKEIEADIHYELLVNGFNAWIVDANQLIASINWKL
ncbi:MAG: thioesterase [Acidimicrobiia bacterium]